MTVNWFDKGQRGRILSTTDFKITFTEAPKGIRLNVALTRAMSEVLYVRVGIMKKFLVLKPTSDEEDFKLVTNKSSAQICAATVGDWAIGEGFVKKRVTGVWNAENEQYEFDLDTIEIDVPEETTQAV